MTINDDYTIARSGWIAFQRRLRWVPVPTAGHSSPPGPARVRSRWLGLGRRVPRPAPLDGLPLAADDVNLIRLDLPETLSLEEWQAIGARLLQLERSVQWAIGDWLRYGERKFGEKYKQALKATGYDYGYLRNLKYVAERFDVSRRRDNLAWSHHAEVASLPASEQETFLDRAVSKGWKRSKMRLAIRDHKRRKSKQVEEAQRTALLGEQGPQECSPPESVQLFPGDFRELLEDMEGGSVDLILTDPPYGKYQVGLYGNLAAQARRILKPGGSLLVMAIPTFLPAILQDMGRHLEWQWQLGYPTPATPTRLWRGQWYVYSRWKSILWYTNGPGAISGLYDVLKSGERDKTFHEWGQPEEGFDYLIEKLTEEGDTVLDPFMGAGTTGVVAMRLGRKFIGIDIDPKMVEIACRRLAAVAEAAAAGYEDVGAVNQGQEEE